jgi:HEAT repeat protein
MWSSIGITGAVLLTITLKLTCAQEIPSTATGETQATPVESRTWQLLRTLRDPEGPTPEAVGLQLRTLGTGVLDPLMAVLQERQVPAPEQEGGPLQVLSEAQTEAVLLALAGFERRVAMPYWTSRFGNSIDTDACEPALLALGGFGRAEDLKLIWTLALGKENEEYSKALRINFREATASILRRDPRGFARILHSWPKLSETLLDDVILAIGQSGDSRGLKTLSDVLMWSPQHARLIASQIPLIGPANKEGPNQAIAIALAPNLASEAKEDIQAVALALAVLESFEPVPELIRLLEDPRPGINDSAHFALVSLTGNELAGRKDLWENWYARELSWSRNDRAMTIRRLRSGTNADLHNTLREISKYRLHRHELAQSISPLLAHPSESVRLTTARVLADLGSRWVGNKLVLALSDHSEAVRAAAHAALMKITGLEMGEEPDSWLEIEFPGDFI